MDAKTRDPGLRKPWFVFLIGACFLLAPLGNLILSLKMIGNSGWYLPSQWYYWSLRLEPSEYLWIFLTMVAGGSLMIRHKLSWLVAISALMVVSVISIIRFFGGGVYSFGANPWSVVFPMSSLSILFIVLHFRYPYLDRRESLFGSMALRCDLRVPLEVSLGGVSFSSYSRDFSNTGFFAEWPPEGIPEALSDLQEGKNGELVWSPQVRWPFSVVRLNSQGFGARFEMKDHPRMAQEVKNWLAKALNGLNVRPGEDNAQSTAS